MRSRPTTWLALGLWLLTLALLVAALVMKAEGWRGEGSTSVPEQAMLILAFFLFATMGALVVALRPKNVLGWIFLGIGLGAFVSALAEILAFHNFVENPGSIPAATAIAWLYAWTWYPTIGLVGFVLLLYPTGTLPGPRWRFVAWALGALVALVALSYWFYPGRLDEDKRLPPNPIGMHWVRVYADPARPIVNASLIALLVAAAASVVVRFRRSRGDERQQMKWMAFAAVTLACGFVLSTIGSLGDLFFAIAIAQLPIALGIAIFKYRLYDIDRLISRTLVYGATTAILGAAYVALVLGGQTLFSTAAGGSHLLVAASTLVVAALFLPLRRRIQTLVDRRFYRRRYDAQQTLEAFSARLRQHVELETLGGGLLGVIDDTMEPTHVELWLRATRP